MSAIKYDNDKLIQILEDNDVSISTRGNICLNHLVENVMKSKNPTLYMSKIADKRILGKNYYVTPDKCVELLEATNLKTCKKICTKIYIDDSDKEILQPNTIIKYDNDKLVQIMEDNNVNISKGKICLNDLVENVMKSKNPILYMSKIPDKRLHKKKYYITLDKCFEILETTKFKTCKDIYTKICADDNNKESIIDFKNEIIQLEGFKFTAFFVRKKDSDQEVYVDGDQEVYVKASQVTKLLGYETCCQTIDDHVGSDNKMTFLQLCEIYKITVPKKHIDKTTIFINMNGMMDLAARSRKPNSNKLAKLLKLPIHNKRNYHETQILHNLFEFFDSSNIKYIHQHSVKHEDTYYLIDCYLPQHKIAIEIDERGHRDRCQIYEKCRENYIKKTLGCTFVRCNPDDPKFSIYKFIGDITNKIIHNKIDPITYVLYTDMPFVDIILRITMVLSNYLKSKEMCEILVRKGLNVANLNSNGKKYNREMTKFYNELIMDKKMMDEVMACINN